MKTKMFLILNLLFSFNLFSQEINLKGYLSIWEKKEGEIIPKEIIKNIQVNLLIKTPSSPNTFEIKKFIYKTTQTYTLDIDLSFYSIFPLEGSVYFVAQISIKGDINITCGAYLNKEDFIPFPVIFCSGIKEDKMIGITLSRIKQQKL